MANMKQFSGSESKHLKAKDFLGKHMKAKISDVQIIEFEARDNQPAQTKAVLLFEGREKGLVLNGTNNDALCSAYGDDSEGWLGRQVQLTTKEYENFAPGWIVTPTDVDFDDDLPW